LRGKGEGFVSHSETKSFRDLGRKSLKSLIEQNQRFRGIVLFQWLSPRFVSLFSSHALFPIQKIRIQRASAPVPRFRPVEHFSLAPINHTYDSIFSKTMFCVSTYTGPSGNLPFQLVYGECCGAPATLVVNLPLSTPGTPELSTWGMMAVGFGAIGFLAYRRGRPAKALASA
jgi:hypothetical protein